MADDDLDRTVPPPFATRRPTPRWEYIIDLLAIALVGLGLLVGVALPKLLPDGRLLDSRLHLSDIGVLLFIAGTPFYLASAILSDRRKGSEVWRRLLHLRSVRLLMLGTLAFTPFAIWLAVADLSAPPHPLGPPPMLPDAANMAMGAALCLALLGIVFAVPERLWRSWRERRARIYALQPSTHDTATGTR